MKVYARLLFSLVTVFSITVLATGQENLHLCQGIIEENDLFIPMSALEESNIDEQEFNRVIDEAQRIYAPIVAAAGGELVIRKRWSDGTVNAYANRTGNTWMVTMFGGLARHPAITSDGLMLVVCHEIGHHMGGAPKYGGMDWASNEGQSDYFANLKCMRNIFPAQQNALFVAENEIPAVVRQFCEEQFNTIEEENLCMRSSMAGDSLARLFKAIRNESTEPDFATPDPREVRRTSDSHPATQCRLDTYFNGSLCPKSKDDGLSDEDPIPGTCNRTEGVTKGTRPHCWFKP